MGSFPKKDLYLPACRFSALERALEAILTTAAELEQRGCCPISIDTSQFRTTTPSSWHAGRAGDSMESFPVSGLVVAFVIGAIVGYGIRAFISAKRRAHARRHRRHHFFDDN